ncbi:glycine/D-amino acid oxidase-like deaminating enzyme [Nocardioides thalensis]|uniref:Glycine/D-amino acid oxidase-like deaminating enzyme n=1 Tax=Nocardioides thalensis TaxID=1914755 RepID=A0A853C811_9ACTN|nr:glycine/D-amino acid oxidase-like deaminating enzyme [Nocardioides thalensis]
MADVVIIGGGLTGLGTAVELADRGAEVVVLEKDGLGFEQTVRSNAALRLPGPGPLAIESESVTGASMVGWDQFEDRFGEDIELDRGGWSTLVVDDDDRAWLAAQSTTLGVSEQIDLTALTPPDEVRARWPALAGEFLGMHTKPGGHVNRMRVVAALHRAALARGARFSVGTMAVGFDLSRRKITAVRTLQERFSCQQVVIAGGVWTPRLLDALGTRVPMQRVRVPSGETAPIGDRLFPGFIRAGKFTMRQSADGVVRFGGGYRAPEYVHDLSLDDVRDLRTWAPALLHHVRGATFRVDWAIARNDLRRRRRRLRNGPDFVPTGWEPRPWRRYSESKLASAARVVPSLANHRLQRTSSGVVDITPDFEPYVGRVPTADNAWVAAGMSGHGFILGPGTWRAVAEGIVDGRSALDLRPYRVDRFAQLP